MFTTHPDLATVRQSQLHREASDERLAALARRPRASRPAVAIARRWTPSSLRHLLPGTPPRVRIDPARRAA